VEDDGAGMSDEVLRRVFEPFFSTKAQGEGTGLGLAVSRGLVASLGGKLELQSAAGRGTRGIVELAEAAVPAARPRQAPSASPRGRRRELLLVDDDRAVLRALTRILEPHYTVHPAGSVDEALAVADLRRPDVLVADVVMPDGGGPAMYRALRAQDPDLASRVVFITGGAAKEPVRHFLSSQPQPVLEKPIDHDVLARIVERLSPDGAGASRGGRH
jgi:CheY-like chemotaxis protein